MKKFFKLFAIALSLFLAIFIVLGIIGSVMLDNEKEKIVETKTEAVSEIVYDEISAGNIIKLYEQNELNADKLLKDRRIIIAGKVSSVEKVFGQVYVTLSGDDEWGITQVQCYFDNDNVDALISINTGDIVKIEGTVEGKGWNVDVVDCILR